MNVAPLIRSGDALIVLLGAGMVGGLGWHYWQGGLADKVVIRAGGKVFREVALSRDQDIAVPGPLGMSLIRVEKRRVRILADPSPRQYCVRQGWLQQVGEMALCLPNQVSIELTGQNKPYDSLNY